MSTPITERRKVWHIHGALLGYFAAVAFDEGGTQWLWYVDETYTMRRIALSQTRIRKPVVRGNSQKDRPRRKKAWYCRENG